MGISLTYSDHRLKPVYPKILQMINFNLSLFLFSYPGTNFQNFNRVNNAKNKIGIRSLSNVWFPETYATSNTVFLANFQIRRIS